MTLFDFEAQYTFYGQYHNHVVNKVIHVTCVPAIVFTILVWTSLIDVPLISNVLAPLMAFKASHFLLTFYSIYYVLLEPMAGLLYVPLMTSLVYGASLFILTFPDDYVRYSVIIHVGSWIAQFIGHGVFEGRAPALIDNLAQAFLMAPFFVFVEVLFALGYRPLLHKRIQAKVDKAIAEWKTKKSR